MKPFSLYTEEKPLEHKVNNPEVSAKFKQQIKQLRGKRVRLEWKINGWSYSIACEIKNCYKIRFVFRINGSTNRKLRYDEITNIEEL
jgi:ribose 1,5-bisphosphokinase PhnN